MNERERRGEYNECLTVSESRSTCAKAGGEL